MTKDELKEKIKVLVKQVYKPASSNSIDIDEPGEISLDSDKFPILLKFPSLKDAIESLLTLDYEPFITDIQWVAPKPLTFRIILTNGEMFYLTYTPKSWIAQIEGKKYYLLNLSEEEAATEAIARILAYGIAEEKTEPGAEGEAAAETPVEEPAAEEPAPEEEA